jgi:hypothetical protein
MAERKKKNNPNQRPQSYRQRLLIELEAKYPHYNFKSNLLGGLFLLGVILTIWEIYIYRVTFISVYIPIAIWILSGILMTPLLKRTFNIYCFNPYRPGQTPMFFHYLYNIVSFGGILIFLFMWINQTFNDKTKTVVTVPIVSYGHFAKSRRSCGEPYVHVIYKEIEKELVFPCGIEIEKYSSVYIEITKGLFGFEIIMNKNLIKEQW